MSEDIQSAGAPVIESSAILVSTRVVDDEKKAREAKELIDLKEEFIASKEVCGPRILIEVDAPEIEEKANESKLYIPQEVKDRERHSVVSGIVRAMGNTCYNLESHRDPQTGEFKKWVQVGDRVWFSQYAGSRFIGKGLEFLYMLMDEDIWCKEIKK